MSGIVGLVNGHHVAADLVQALSRLNDTGLDPVTLVVAGPGATVRRGASQIDTLRRQVNAESPQGRAGIAEAGLARPHVWDGVSVVCCGEIENATTWRAVLSEEGHVFHTGADAEVVPHVIAEARANAASPIDAMRMACDVLHGSYVMAALFEDVPGLVLVAGHGGVVVVGDGARGSAVASDPRALEGLCRRYASLEDGDIAELTDGCVHVIDHRGEPAIRLWQQM